MEEGGKIRPRYNESNKDHLATVQYSVKTREKNKQWLVCGFNGFGQLNFENKRMLTQFEEFQMHPTITNAILMACSWSCLAIANGCSLHIQGFLSNSQKIKSINTETPIKYIDICEKFCLVLLENGKVFKLLLGFGDELKEITFQASLKPIIPQKRSIFGKCIFIKSHLEISHIACGNNITIAISTTNAVFSGTTQIYQFPTHQRTKQLKCGFEHALLLTTNGDIYAWGNGLRGQLGLEVLRLEEIPTIIEALAGIKITYIAAGGWHSAAISAFNDLYTWGFNSNGQLGLRLYKTQVQTLKEPSVYPLPQFIDLAACQCSKNKNDMVKSSCYPIKVAAGGRHTILKRNCGSITASGWNTYGQLGLTKSQHYRDNFEFVHKLDENNAQNTQIICGNWCTLIQK